LAAPAAPADDPPKPGQNRVEHLDFAGRLEAVDTVELRSRLTGTVEKVLFHEGAAVRQGDVLFELDARASQAEVQKAEADMVRAKAAAQLADAAAERLQRLRENNAVGQDEIAQAVAARDRARAGLLAAEAGLQ